MKKQPIDLYRKNAIINNMEWNIVIHPKALSEINDLPLDMRAKLTRLLELMEIMGPLHMREPHVKSLGNKLMEIRLTGKDGISRVIYALISKRRVALLHAFVKKTQKTPKEAITCAIKRLEEF